MRAVFVFCGMAPCTEACLASKSCYRTGLSWITSPRYERIIPVRSRLYHVALNAYLSSGYDLKQLFIGAEGTLGVVTGVSILTPPAPRAVNNVILALPKFENVLPLFKLARGHLSEILSAFEYIDRTAYELAVKHGQGKGLSDEEVEGAECFVLLETSGGSKDHDEEVRIFLSAYVESLIKTLIQRNSTPSSKRFSNPISP